LFFSDPPWETTVLLKCDSKEEKGDFKVWRKTYPQEVVSDEETIKFNRLKILNN